jgi:sec-independent protein translocase protein TatC
MILAFGLCFEMPVLAYALGKIGLLSSSFLARGRKIAIVVILIVAAVLTPTPDVFTQLLLAVPMYLLYEISIVVVRLTGRRK